MRERIEPRAGARAGDGVTVSWRKASARLAPVLSITLGKAAIDRLGLKPGLRVIAERDRMAGKLFLKVDPDTGWKPAWKQGCCALFIPLDDVTSDRRSAQTVATSWDGAELCIKLPAWACPPIKIGVGRAA